MNKSDNNLLVAEQKIINAHEFLIKFLSEFDKAQRGGIHDFMEITLCNMVDTSIANIDKYLKSGHTNVNASEIMHIVTDSYQKVLDGVKRNLGEMKPVNFK